MPMRTALLAAVPLLAAAVPAAAQDKAVAFTQIVAGAYDQAESRLDSELRIHPGRPELLINLAAVYAKTGRTTEARALYRQVLSQDDVLMDLSETQSVGSHALARAGLRRTEAVQFTAR
jgi:Flp pilus assembly protein TadD